MQETLFMVGKEVFRHVFTWTSMPMFLAGVLLLLRFQEGIRARSSKKRNEDRATKLKRRFDRLCRSAGDSFDPEFANVTIQKEAAKAVDTWANKKRISASDRYSGVVVADNIRWAAFILALTGGTCDERRKQLDQAELHINLAKEAMAEWDKVCGFRRIDAAIDAHFRGNVATNQSSDLGS